MAAWQDEDEMKTSFWQEIERLTHRLRRGNRTRQINKASINKNLGKHEALPQLSRTNVINKIELFIAKLLTSLSRNELPVIRFKNRSSWSNVSFNHAVGVEMKENALETSVRLDSTSSIQKYAVTIKILSIAYKLLQENAYCTKRDIYYNDVPFFGNQSVVDHAVDNISCMLDFPRHSLHILACSKGYVSGQLTFREHDGNYIDCSVNITGNLIPSHVQGIYDVSSNAKAILVVEKEATFQRLLDDNILEKLKPIIVITGKGFPDINTRLLVRKLWVSLEIPVLGLVDADPHGIEIMCVYRFGSKSLSFEADNLTVPAMRWIGVLPSDLQRLSIGQEAQIPLTQQDRKKISHLLQRPYVKAHPSIQQELQVMLCSNYKAEMQALSTISTGFLTDIYLPIKLRHGKWV